MDAISAFDAAVKQRVDAGEVPGVAAILFDTGGNRYEAAHGRRSVATNAPMEMDTIFWFASMTKAIVSAAAMQLVEQNRVQLDEPVAKYLPALGAPKVLEGFDADGAPRLRPATRAITPRLLLNHTAGFSYDTWDATISRYMRENDFLSLLNARKRDLLLPLVSEPGEAWNYGINIDWVGQLIEAVSGLSLRDYLRRNILDPIGMHNTDFIISASGYERLARVCQRQADGSFREIEHQVSQTPEFYMGGGGLYGTARDYAAFLQTLLNGGVSGNGRRVLKSDTVALMGQNHVGDLEAGRLKSVFPETSADIDFFPGMSQKWGLSFLINTET
jgi:methyl acetate hydrolase